MYGGEQLLCTSETMYARATGKHGHLHMYVCMHVCMFGDHYVDVYHNHIGMQDTVHWVTHN
jgi:hypothetical protein